MRPPNKPPATLWDLMSEDRNRAKRTPPATLLELARLRGVTVTWGDLRNIDALDARRGGDAITPSFVAAFIAEYAKQLAPKSVLDPWASVGSTLIPIVETCNTATATGIVRRTDQIEIARFMAADYPVKWLQGNPSELLPSLNEYDLIVSVPPWGLPNETVGGGKTEFRASGTFALVFESAQHLTSDGVAMFILPNSFLFQQDARRVREALKSEGVHLNAVVSLPATTWFPSTNIASNIVVFSRIETPDLFVCQLSQSGDPTTLLKQLWRRKDGPSLELGRLIDPQEFRTFQVLKAEEEEERLAQRSGLTAVPLGDVVATINLGKQTEDGGFQNVPNTVYLPLIGTSPAVTALSDPPRIKLHNYAQLIIRPEVAHAEFIAGFLNSALGRKLRRSLESGTTIPKISKTTLSAARLYLLPLASQLSAMNASRELQDVRLRLEQLERDLWNRPIEAEKVRKELSTFNQEEGFESWLETLPFPLASILWRYEAAGNAEHKVSHLLNAFEAFAQFLGTLMASAFHSNPEFFRENRANWFDQGKDNPHSLARSNFGEWVVRAQRLAKTTRQMLSSNDESRAVVLALYRADALKVDGIANKSIYAVLENVSRYRNDWKGHAGIVSAREHEAHLALLQEELTRLRGALGGVFEDWWLIRPGKSSFKAGIFRYTAESIMGSRQIFKQIEVPTPEPMDDDEIYCYDTVTQRPLQLLRFVRMLSAPDEQEIACYFYNRLEKNSIKWVSYHFEKEASRLLPDPSVLKLIKEAEEDDGGYVIKGDSRK